MFDDLLSYLNGNGTTSLTLGLKWLVVDLVISLALVVSLERLFPLNLQQRFFRGEWRTDFQYFAVNHMAFGLPLIPATFLSQMITESADASALRSWAANLPFPVALLLVAVIADLVQYWTHRMYHRVPFLWRFHAVHHSAKTLDWMSGSRQHIFEMILTRTLILVPFMALGFTTSVLNTFIVLGGIQAVLNHSNINARMGWLGYVIVTPKFHHWHHSRAKKAVDRNFASHFAFLDHIFGTAVKDQHGWPIDYGLQNDQFPKGILAQFISPFTKAR